MVGLEVWLAEFLFDYIGVKVMLYSECGAVRKANWEVGEDGDESVGGGRFEGEVMGDFVDG